MTSICCISLAVYDRGSSYPITNVSYSHHSIKNPEERKCNFSILVLILFQDKIAVRAMLESKWTELAALSAL
jgi:hypothetical protein